MGHKRIDETMLYVHVAENHPRDIPEDIVSAAHGGQTRIAESCGCLALVAAVAASAASAKATSIFTAV